ncbi:MAG: HPr(Ser) kinase/phosphatase [Acidobacteria bacterium]|nr:MAG: HPr(Ser) kinase/phosphatase [Acidobacteriota bacterium]REK01391.1 MAG: HPr(Ser) kinase/phosphatase [Acidobacteriota bacterium]REK14347.1 MAG: HPr(Ser) kinase/phosphatase [Acidobacteriota bacterium]REK45062.1 MAG: HPr(Ser) kinase/phosphatase [Acidobacteriota bacterium]
MPRPPGKKPAVTIREFFANAPARLKLELISGEESLEENHIDSDRIQKLGLALAGYAHYIHKGRLQIMGQSETSYLNQLSPERRTKAVENLDLQKICCVLVTKGLEVPEELSVVVRNARIPLLRTDAVSSVAIAEVSGFLQRVLAPSITVHGVLLGMYGVGVLLLGESGIGKSECALDLVTRGYRLISDDSVIIKRIGELLEGSSPPLTADHLEIRGLGILNIRDLFGVSATGTAKVIDLCIELKRWDEVVDVDRLGLETAEEEIFGIDVPKYVLPVSSGRNLTTLVETAVRIHLLKAAGHDGARKLIERHSRAVGGQGDEN